MTLQVIYWHAVERFCVNYVLGGLLRNTWLNGDLQLISHLKSELTESTDNIQMVM